MIPLQDPSFMTTIQDPSSTIPMQDPSSMGAVQDLSSMGPLQGFGALGPIWRERVRVGGPRTHFGEACWPWRRKAEDRLNGGLEAELPGIYEAPLALLARLAQPAITRFQSRRLDF